VVELGSTLSSRRFTKGRGLDLKRVREGAAGDKARGSYVFVICLMGRNTQAESSEGLS
jgi:hypothetical protein